VFDSRCICGHPTHTNTGGCGACISEDCKCERLFNWPEVDDWEVPKVKLPNCPGCGEDELALIHRNYMTCYVCSWELHRTDYEKHPRAFA
jgi:hypothetical protein